MRYAAIAMLAVMVASAGCSKKKKKQPEGDQTAERQPAGGEMSEVEKTREAKRQAYAEKKAEMKRRRVPMQITLDDVKDEIPALDSLEPLGEAKVGPSGRRVEAELCARATDAEAVAKSLEQTLAGGGWTELNHRAMRNGAGVGMGGKKGPLRVTAMIRADAPRCSDKAGKHHVLLRYHKLLTKEAAQQK